MISHYRYYLLRLICSKIPYAGSDTLQRLDLFPTLLQYLTGSDTFQISDTFKKPYRMRHFSKTLPGSVTYQKPCLDPTLFKYLTRIRHFSNLTRIRQFSKT